MQATARGRAAGWVVVAIILITQTASPASAQTTYHLTGTAGTTDWLTPTNWNPNGPPAYRAAANTDIASFGTTGTSVTATA